MSADVTGFGQPTNVLLLQQAKVQHYKELQYIRICFQCICSDDSGLSIIAEGMEHHQDSLTNVLNSSKGEMGRGSLIRRWILREREDSDLESLLVNESPFRGSEAESSCGDFSALRSATSRGKRAWLFFDNAGKITLQDVSGNICAE